jgi:hypothetical protein
MVAFTRASLEILQKANARSSLMPLAEAVLLAEAIETGKLDIRDTELQHVKDLMDGQPQ